MTEDQRKIYTYLITIGLTLGYFAGHILLYIIELE